MEARTGTLDPTADASRRVAERFAHWRTAGSEEFFEALARHFAHLRDHPVLPLHFEYAVTANERGRAAAPSASRGLLEAAVAAGCCAAPRRACSTSAARTAGFLVAFAERGRG